MSCVPPLCVLLGGLLACGGDPNEQPFQSCTSACYPPGGCQEELELARAQRADLCEVDCHAAHPLRDGRGLCLSSCVGVEQHCPYDLGRYKDEVLACEKSCDAATDAALCPRGVACCDECWKAYDGAIDASESACAEQARACEQRCERIYPE